MKRTAFLLALTIFLLPFCTKEKPPDPDMVYDPTPFTLEYPDFFPILEIPADNPTTVEGYCWDVCSITTPFCTQRQHGGLCKLPPAGAFLLQTGQHYPPPQFGLEQRFLWNGKVQGSLEDIMLFEARDFFETDLSRIQNHPDYPKRFFEAFGSKDVTYENIAKALSQFERTMISSNSKYDAYLDPGQLVFLDDDEFMGYDIFFTEKGTVFTATAGYCLPITGFTITPSTRNPSLVYSRSRAIQRM
ncbi:MAG: hypothetical protein IPL49_10810 [Saprospirales bacterium]|nr:hypothetical protein [Saprospirales bacterium]